MILRTLILISIAMCVSCSKEGNVSVSVSNDIISEIQIDNDITKLKPTPNPNRNAYFGDLHVHTANSFDAYTFGTISTPADAYRYAQGQAIPHPTGYAIQLSRPLDFYAVTDHAMFLGLLKEAA
ncbi:MAG TPA: DUF3604 domain-containing protein, partial [Gammaproteobacteria bacterium]|nr:DUF3604 domain-containing protein [Gammaproteobacteria bacterium]